MKNVILITCLLQTVFAAPQFITFKDGQVGVNFLGYHAEAGLGGGQNGGGLLGGLHASAGTPWGQNAGAGLGGNVNGRASGVLYAGAQATPDVGAGAILGGDTSQGGFSGSEAYANGKVNSRTRTTVTKNTENWYENPEPQYAPQPAAENVNVIQKIRPPKKYYASEMSRAASSFNNESVNANTQNTKSIQHDIQQDKPAVAATINKTAFATLFHNNEKHNIATSSLAKIAGSDYKFNSNNQANNNELKATPTPALALSTTSPSSSPPSGTQLPFVAFSHILNENIAKGVDDNNLTAIIITRDKTKLRTRAHKQHRNHQHHHPHRNHQKRINGNRLLQRSKTIVKVVEQSTEHQQQNSFIGEEKQQPQQHQEHYISQINHQQHQPARRQLIAAAPPPAPYAAPPCDYTRQQCNNINKDTRPDMVQNALQIPIGILQSLQQTLGNRRAH